MATPKEQLLLDILERRKTSSFPVVPEATQLRVDAVTRLIKNESPIDQRSLLIAYGTGVPEHGIADRNDFQDALFSVFPTIDKNNPEEYNAQIKKHIASETKQDTRPFNASIVPFDFDGLRGNIIFQQNDIYGTAPSPKIIIPSGTSITDKQKETLVSHVNSIPCSFISNDKKNEDKTLKNVYSYSDYQNVPTYNINDEVLALSTVAYPLLASKSSENISEITQKKLEDPYQKTNDAPVTPLDNQAALPPYTKDSLLECAVEKLTTQISQIPIHPPQPQKGFKTHNFTKEDEANACIINNTFFINQDGQLTTEKTNNSTAVNCNGINVTVQSKKVSEIKLSFHSPAYVHAFKTHLGLSTESTGKKTFKAKPPVTIELKSSTDQEAIDKVLNALANNGYFIGRSTQTTQSSKVNTNRAVLAIPPEGFIDFSPFWDTEKVPAKLLSSKNSFSSEHSRAYQTILEKQIAELNLSNHLEVKTSKAAHLEQIFINLKSGDSLKDKAHLQGLDALRKTLENIDKHHDAYSKLRSKSLSSVQHQALMLKIDSSSPLHSKLENLAVSPSNVVHYGQFYSIFPDTSDNLAITLREIEALIKAIEEIEKDVKSYEKLSKCSMDESSAKKYVEILAKEYAQKTLTARTKKIENSYYIEVAYPAETSGTIISSVEQDIQTVDTHYEHTTKKYGEEEVKYYKEKLSDIPELQINEYKTITPSEEAKDFETLKKQNGLYQKAGIWDINVAVSSKENTKNVASLFTDCNAMSDDNPDDQDKKYHVIIQQDKIPKEESDRELCYAIANKIPIIEALLVELEKAIEKNKQNIPDDNTLSTLVSVSAAMSGEKRISFKNGKLVYLYPEGKKTLKENNDSLEQEINSLKTLKESIEQYKDNSKLNEELSTYKDLKIEEKFTNINTDSEKATQQKSAYLRIVKEEVSAFNGIDIKVGNTSSNIEANLKTKDGTDQLAIRYINEGKKTRYCFQSFHVKSRGENYSYVSFNNNKDYYIVRPPVSGSNTDLVAAPYKQNYIIRNTEGAAQTVQDLLTAGNTTKPYERIKAEQTEAPSFSTQFSEAVERCNAFKPLETLSITRTRNETTVTLTQAELPLVLENALFSYTIDNAKPKVDISIQWEKIERKEDLDTATEQLETFQNTIKDKLDKKVKEQEEKERKELEEKERKEQEEKERKEQEEKERKEQEEKERKEQEEKERKEQEEKERKELEEKANNRRKAPKPPSNQTKLNRLVESGKEYVTAEKGVVSLWIPYQEESTKLIPNRYLLEIRFNYDPTTETPRHLRTVVHLPCQQECPNEEKVKEMAQISKCAQQNSYSDLLNKIKQAPGFDTITEDTLQTLFRDKKDFHRPNTKAGRGASVGFSVGESENLAQKNP